MVNKKSKLVLAAVVAVTGVVVGGLAFSNVVDAQRGSNSESKMAVYEKVSEKLGIDRNSDEFEAAFKEARAELKTEKATEKLSEAVTQGTITQEQADLSLQLRSLMTEVKESFDKPEFDEDMTTEERKAQREEMKAQFEASFEQALSDAGISQDEVDELKETMKEAGFEKSSKGKGRGGFRK